MQRYLNLLMKNGHINLLGNIDGRVINEYWVIPNDAVSSVEEYTVDSIVPTLKELAMIDFKLSTIQNMVEVYKAIEDNSVELIVQSVTDLTDELDINNPKIKAIKEKLLNIVASIEPQLDIDVISAKNDFVLSLHSNNEVFDNFQKLKEEINAALYEVECLISEKNRDNDYIVSKLDFINDETDLFTYQVSKIKSLLEEYEELNDPISEKEIALKITAEAETLKNYFSNIQDTYVKIFRKVG